MNELYSTLLGLNVGVLGFVIAVILVYAEVVISRYSHRALRALIRKNWLFWCTIVISSLGITLSGIGLLTVSSLDSGNTPVIDLGRMPWAESIPLLSVVLILSILQYLSSFVLLFSYLDSSPIDNVFEQISKEIDWDSFKLYLLSTYGLPDPASLKWQMQYRNTTASEADLAKIRNRLYRQIKTKNVSDPFLPLLDTISSAISRHDREGLRSGLATLRHTLQSLFSELTKDSDRALIENTIERYIGQEILSQLHLLLEVTEQEGYPSFARDLIDTVGKLGEAALEDETTGTVTEAMVNGFLDPFAERNLKPGDEENFTSALRAMTDIGVSAARKQQGRVTIEVIRSLGKTAEVFINTGRDISRSHIANRTFREQQLIDSVVNSFWRIGLSMENKAQLLPEYHVYASVVAKVAERFVVVATEENGYSDVISALLFNFTHLAEVAASTGNSNALFLSCHHLGEIYKELGKNDALSHMGVRIAESFADIGSTASVKNYPLRDLHPAMSLPKECQTIVGLVILRMVDVLSAEHLQHAMMKVYDDFMLPMGNDLIWTQFVVPTIKMTGNNFGLPYDRETGEDLTEWTC